MNENEVLKIFELHSALLKGHFLLTSGLHSPQFLQCALVLQHPAIAEKLCAGLVERIKNDERIGAIDLVIAPALGGIIVAHEAGRALDLRALFTDRQEGSM